MQAYTRRCLVNLVNAIRRLNELTSAGLLITSLSSLYRTLKEKFCFEKEVVIELNALV